MAHETRENLAGTRILITGASSGVGMAAARAFATEGARVALLARRAQVIEDLARELGDGALPLPADVTDSRAVSAAVAAAADAFGGLDVAINAAGVGMPTPLETLDPPGWQEVIDINLSGTFFVAREAGLRMLEAGGGAIVNVGSELSSVGMGMYSAYCASKFGVIGLTKALAAELAPTVRVNVVCPGPIDTPMMDAELDWFPDPEATRREATERVPLKRFAAPEEVVGAIRFLAFSAPFATGTVLPFDGGTTMV
ncbi:MAG TPA: SDR family oxidoreductase [Thermoleophilaceae bacterium]|jgi:NAD(P)-dependent dehydrogenase (short-subunit alcohol dehydrogenase family)